VAFSGVIILVNFKNNEVLKITISLVGKQIAIVDVVVITA